MHDRLAGKQKFPLLDRVLDAPRPAHVEAHRFHVPRVRLGEYMHAVAPAALGEMTRDVAARQCPGRVPRLGAKHGHADGTADIHVLTFVTEDEAGNLLAE